MKTKKVRVVVVPTAGESQVREATVPMRGATVKDALESVGVAMTNVDIMVDGQPATLETKITAKSKVQAKTQESKVQAKTQVTVTERPRGS